MKKNILLAIVILTSSILNPSFAFAAPKEFTKCTEIGKISGKLTCVSIDKKKFWYEITLAKGVKKYARVDTDCYRENMITTGYNLNKQIVSLICKYPTIVKGPVAKWTLLAEDVTLIDKSNTQISIDNLDLIGVPHKSYENVISVLKSRPKSTFKISFISGPNVSKSLSDKEIAGLDRAIDLWAPYFNPEKVQTVYVMPNDEDWLENKSRELGLSSMVPPGETWTMRMKMWSPCGFAMAGLPNNVPTIVQCLGAGYVGGSRQTGPHEYTHLFQRSYGGQNAHLMPWYTEGSASYFGWTLGFYPNDSALLERKAWLNSLFRGMPYYAIQDFQSKDINKFKDIMKSLDDEFNTPQRASISYWVGGLATEVLIALYGFDKFIDLTKGMQNTSDISTLLNQTYGFNADYFYEKLAPYVWSHMPR